MSLENKLAENMIRFGVKNLSEQSNQKLTRLSEQLISEQLKVKLKWGKWHYHRWKRGNAGDQSIPFKDYQKNLVNKDPTTWDAYLKDNEAKFVRVLDPENMANWQELKTDETNKGYAVAALEQFNASYGKFKWKYAYCDTEDGVEQRIMKLAKVAPPKTPVDYNGISAPTIEFPSQGMGSNFFVDNLFAPTTEFEAAVTADIINPLIEKAALMKTHPKTTEASKKYPKFHLDELYVVTSCSRFRNTGAAKEMTFSELAKARAEAARDYIISRLKALGEGIVVVDKESDIQIKFDGENGDGSSGPNPLAPYQVPRDDNGRAGMQNEIWSAGSGEARRDNWGNPLASKALYDDFKYCRAGVGLSANLAWMTPPDEEPGRGKPEYEVIIINIPTKDYGVYFFSPQRYGHFKWRLPWLDFSGKIKKPMPPKWFRTFRDWIKKLGKKKFVYTGCFFTDEDH